MQRALDLGRRVLDAARELLKGEPLRAIGYGAGVVIFLVTNASGRFEDVPLDTAITLAAGAATTLIGIIETARRFVYSFNTVTVIAAEAAETGDPTIPAPPADNLPEVDLDA